MKSLEFAIKMELDGEKYYLEQAELRKGTVLEQVFTMLAEDEREHARLLELHAEKHEYEFTEGRVYSAFRSIFENASEFRLDEKEIPSQLDVYQHAIGFEDDAIKLYQELLAEAETEADKKLFKFLVEEEQRHKQVFQDIVEHLRKADQWVESAEFGLQEDY